MKKSFMLTLALVTFFVFGSYAQGFHIGVKGGQILQKLMANLLTKSLKWAIV